MMRRQFLKRYYQYRSKDSITIEEVLKILKAIPDAILLDVRSIQEYKEGHLTSSINIPLHELDRFIKRVPNKNATIILYCQSGIRSLEALKLLKKYGYTNVYNIEGGLDNI